MKPATLLLLTGGPPFVPAPRRYAGCMGRIVPGVEFIEGAYRENPELVFSWLLYRYTAASQAKILAFFKDAGDEDFLLSWPDFDSQDPQAFLAQILQVRRAGFRPCVMLCSKAGPRDLAGLQNAISPILPILKQGGVPRVCVGWELNFLPPGSVKVDPPDPGVLQPLIDWLAPIITSWGAFLYVHFIPGYGAWQQDGLHFADFWRRNVGLLRGVLHQKVTAQTDTEYQFAEGGLHDILLHFNGGSGCPADSGDGTPFDLIAFEVNLEIFSLNQISEAEYHRRATVGILTPPTAGPTGIVRVQGSGSGR